mgnify:CR=1 FL=1
MLDQQATSRQKVPRCTANYRTQAGQTVAPAHPIGQRHPRLERQTVPLQVRIAISNVGWIGDDQVIPFARQRRVPVPGEKANCNLVTPGILPGHSQRLGRQVDRGKHGRRNEMADRHRKHSGAGAKIQDARRHFALKRFDCKFDQQFRFRARDQNRRVNQKLEAMEFCRTQQVGQWLAGDPPPKPPADLPPAEISRDGNQAVVALLESADKYVKSNQLDKAGAALERALRVEPRNAGIWHDLAQIRLHQGQYQQAESLASKSNNLAGGNRALQSRNWKLIGSARKAAGNAAGADEAEARASQLSH